MISLLKKINNYIMISLLKKNKWLYYDFIIKEK